ncbi:MAG: deoxyguanosinetriphosphate triphosphohydrolase [Clostridiales bacterium]|nr:deoxyguanosinetriphosphate triphosphohydrolase [Clostridiales bacterium]
MTVRERQIEEEKSRLSEYAVCSADSRGRLSEESPCPYRTEFQRDRDRIIHCNSFRRLKHKTQVFLSPLGDHYRTRLTHTLEVSQIARTIARALRLNEDLTEAISLGHDLGHTPFGHAGERVLNEITPFGYKHYLQSVRVVHRLEKNGKGLNLTYEVKNGIACHSAKLVADTLEGRIVKISDKVAYINHDIEDAIRAGVLSEADLPWDAVYILGRKKSERISTIIASIVENSTDDIRMSPEVEKAHRILKQFMFDSVYTNPVAKGEEGKAQGIIEKLYQYYSDNVDKLPAFFKEIADQDGVPRAVCDYISGMTDQFAVTQFKELFIPKSWNI